MVGWSCLNHDFKDRPICCYIIIRKKENAMLCGRLHRTLLVKFRKRRGNEENKDDLRKK